MFSAQGEWWRILARIPFYCDLLCLIIDSRRLPFRARTLQQNRKKRNSGSRQDRASRWRLTSASSLKFGPRSPRRIPSSRQWMWLRFVIMLDLLEGSRVDGKFILGLLEAVGSLRWSQETKTQRWIPEGQGELRQPASCVRDLVNWRFEIICLFRILNLFLI